MVPFLILTLLALWMPTRSTVIPIERDRGVYTEGPAVVKKRRAGKATELAMVTDRAAMGGVDLPPEPPARTIDWEVRDRRRASSGAETGIGSLPRERPRCRGSRRLLVWIFYAPFARDSRDSTRSAARIE